MAKAWFSQARSLSQIENIYFNPTYSSSIFRFKSCYWPKNPNKVINTVFDLVTNFSSGKLYFYLKNNYQGEVNGVLKNKKECAAYHMTLIKLSREHLYHNN